MMFAFSMQLMSITPAYLTFGDEIEGSGETCSLKHVKHVKLDMGPSFEINGGCPMTMISQLYSKI